MENPTCTVVVTTHNRPKMASRAIRSALGQTMRDLEVIVVDDGSTEAFRTEEVDSKVRVIRLEKSGGVCAARNAGMRVANGAWITFLDDDDELLPLMVETSISRAQKSPLPAPVATLAGVEVVDDKGSVIEHRLPVSLERGKHYFLEGAREGESFRTQMSLVVPLAVVKEIGGWDEMLRSWVHDDFFLRLNAVCSLQGQSTILYRQTRHSGNHVHANLLARAEAMERTMQKHQEIFAQYPRRNAHFMASAGITYLRAGRWLPAVRATTRALLTSPRRPKLFMWWLASIGGPRLIHLYRWIVRRAQTINS